VRPRRRSATRADAGARGIGLALLASAVAVAVAVAAGAGRAAEREGEPMADRVAASGEGANMGTSASTSTGASASAVTGAPAGAGDEDVRLEAAYARFADAVREAGEIVRRHPFYREPANRASAYAFITGMLIATLEEDVVQDFDFPLFRVLDFRIREGGDNPDQRYAFAKVRGDATYRIWGTLGTQRGLEFQLYAGEPWRKGGGRSVSTLAFEDVRFDADGRFEVLLSPEAPKAGGPGNWLANAPDATELIVRQVFSDWQGETPGEVHIDRVGFEGKAKPVLAPGDMAARLEKTADDLTRTVATWPEFVRERYFEARPANTLSRPADPTSVGGVKGRFMSNGHFELAPDEALLVTLWPIGARYQGIQLTDPWFSSLEYANRQTSLTADQAHRSADGAYRFVVSARDSGIQNWLDTTGLPNGTILIRFDGSELDRFPPEKVPTAERGKLAEIRARLPRDTPALSAAEREAAIAERRRAVQLRFGK